MSSANRRLWTRSLGRFDKKPSVRLFLFAFLYFNSFLRSRVALMKQGLADAAMVPPPFDFEGKKLGYTVRA